ncbi:MAG TPA: SLBB domain-containing protein, partial [Candidatus Kapabacteria bacterium]|nr:SLBB domain-containing protein [Candidatus Kapabacteria bacterium]
MRNSAHIVTRVRPITLFAMLILVGMAISVYAQPHDNSNRYRMMLRSLGQKDTSRSAQESQMDWEKSQNQDQSSLLEGPVDPKTYILGPGDELTLTIWGNEFITEDLTVMPEGNLVIPTIGTKNIADISIAAAQDSIAKLVSPVYRNARVFLSLTKMRRFKVYCVGWVEEHHALTATPIDRVSDIIERQGGFTQKGSAYLRRIQITHRDGSNDYVDLYPYYLWGDVSSDPYVHDGDAIHVSVANAWKTISIYGSVGAPGDFQYAATDSFSTALRMAQGFLPSSDMDSIEVSRFGKNGVTSEHFYVSLSSIRQEGKGDLRNIPNDFPLQEGDEIFVRAIPRWHVQRTVAIAGEVNYPGRYPIDEDSTTLSQIVAKAKGFTKNASLDDADLIRKSGTNIVDREFDRLQKMIRSEMTDDEYEYYKAKSRERPGLVVVNFPKLFNDRDMREDVVLRDDDSIYIPSTRDYVTIIGEVDNPGRIIYASNLTFNDYIKRADGYSYRANKSGVRVIKTRSGEVYDPRDGSYTIQPGDTIFVPENTETNIWPVFI